MANLSQLLGVKLFYEPLLDCWHRCLDWRKPGACLHSDVMAVA